MAVVVSWFLLVVRCGRKIRIIPRLVRYGSYRGIISSQGYLNGGAGLRPSTLVYLCVSLRVFFFPGGRGGGWGWGPRFFPSPTVVWIPKPSQRVNKKQGPDQAKHKIYVYGAWFQCLQPWLSQLLATDLTHPIAPRI